MSEKIIECNNLTHKYGDYLVYEDLNFTVERGRIFGLLGKNGMGKTTTINIMMGFLRPTSGSINIFGEESHNLSPQTRTRIGLLHEGHLTYDFMTVEKAEKFFSRFYPKWEKKFYYDLMDKMGMNYDHKISNMSCGQRSQVVLGLIMAQDPELMILDDYSMGLDAGYRRLFIDYLKHFVLQRNTTVLITSHIIQDLEKLIDDAIIMGYQEILLQMNIQKFIKSFHQYRFNLQETSLELHKDDHIANFETLDNEYCIYSFKDEEEIVNYINQKGVDINKEDISEVSMTLEDAFIGLTGKY
ncbi:MAG: ABC transporter ATP-binding protein [Candidatus Marinimicrobia bacterium]|nr:ABC transporter ATP-binding protein [Candidatus Neomarinimicrobiota bacterium]